MEQTNTTNTALEEKDLNNLRTCFEDEYKKSLNYILKDSNFIEASDISDVEKVKNLVQDYAKEEYKRITTIKTLIDLAFSSSESSKYIYDSINSDTFKSIPDKRPFIEDEHIVSREYDQKRYEEFNNPFYLKTYTEIANAMNSTKSVKNLDKVISKGTKSLENGLKTKRIGKEEERSIRRLIEMMRQAYVLITAPNTIFHNAVKKDIKEERDEVDALLKPELERIKKELNKDSEVSSETDSDNSLFKFITVLENKKYNDTDTEINSDILKKFEEMPEPFQKAVKSIVALFDSADEYKFYMKKSLSEVKSIVDDCELIKKRLMESEPDFYSRYIEDTRNSLKLKLQNIIQKEEENTRENIKKSAFKKMFSKKKFVEKIYNIRRERETVKAQYDYIDVLNNYAESDANIYELYKFLTVDWNKFLTDYLFTISQDKNKDTVENFKLELANPVADFLDKLPSDFILCKNEFVEFPEEVVPKLMVQ